jgi:hypothetical protein
VGLIWKGLGWDVDGVDNGYGWMERGCREEKGVEWRQPEGLGFVFGCRSLPFWAVREDEHGCGLVLQNDTAILAPSEGTS